MKRFARSIDRRRSAPTAFIITLVLFALLAGCSVGGDDDDDDVTASPETTATEPASGPTPTGAAATSATPEATADPNATEPAPGSTPAASPATTPVTGIGDPPVTVVSVSDVLDDPPAFIDQPVTLDADVVENVDDLAFTMADTGADAPLLVVGAPGVIPADLEAGAYVRVAGVVRAFEQADIELAIGAGLDDDAFDAYAGAPVVIASEVRIGLVSVDGLLADPDVYVDRRVTVTGPLGQIISPQAFTLGALESSNASGELPVVATFRAIAPSIAADKWVRATGTVRTLDAANDDLPAELADLFEDDAFAEFAGGPIVVLDLLEILSDDVTATTGDIVSDPETFAAQPVIVNDTVGTLLAAQAFTLEANGQQLLVVAREGTAPTDLTAGAIVLVNGIVDTFTTTGTDAIVWESLGINPADPSLAAFDGQPAIIADRVDVVAVAD